VLLGAVSVFVLAFAVRVLWWPPVLHLHWVLSAR
jgi:hypothetical protein